MSPVPLSFVLLSFVLLSSVLLSSVFSAAPTVTDEDLQPHVDAVGLMLVKRINHRKLMFGSLALTPVATDSVRLFAFSRLVIETSAGFDLQLAASLRLARLS